MWAIQMESLDPFEYASGFSRNHPECRSYPQYWQTGLSEGTYWLPLFALNAAIVIDVLWHTRNKLIHQAISVDTGAMNLAIRIRYWNTLLPGQIWEEEQDLGGLLHSLVG